MADDTSDVVRVVEFRNHSIANLLRQFQLNFCAIDKNSLIPGSFWGDDEAGLIGNSLFYRQDTPLHSILHETAHYICMDDSRRQHLNTNAGSDIAEENAVCYLQILLSRELMDYGEKQIFIDMDLWQYSFRLGSASRWFYEDAEDAKQWLLTRGLITANNQITGNIRL